MSRHFQRSFSTEFKCGVIQRIEAGERLAAVADELGILKWTPYLGPLAKVCIVVLYRNGWSERYDEITQEV